MILCFDTVIMLPSFACAGGQAGAVIVGSGGNLHTQRMSLVQCCCVGGSAAGHNRF